METAWIQVFILTLTQCIAPAGKMVCQEETVEYHFASEDDCARALVQMVDFAARADNVIVDRELSNCHAAAKETQIYASGDDAKASISAGEGLVLIDNKVPPPDFMQAAHDERLAGLKSCEDTGGVAPCKIGEIIIEAAAETKKTEIWKRRN